MAASQSLNRQPGITPSPCSSSLCHCLSHFLTIKEQEEDGLRYNDKLSTETGNTLLSPLLESIKRKQQKVQVLLRNNEDALIKRCRKKNTKQWEGFLRNHWPHDSVEAIDQIHVDMLREKTHGKIHQHNVQGYGSVLKTPQLNFALFKKDRNSFLATVYYRSAHSFEDWLVHETVLLWTHWKVGAFSMPFIDGCMPLHGDGCGTIRPFDLHELHHGNACSGHVALMHAESLDAVMDFVLATVLDLTTGIQQANRSVEWQDMVANGFLNRQAGTLAAKFVETHPLSPEVDYAGLLELAKSQCEARADGLYDIQTDIGHFLEQVRFHKSLHKHDQTPKQDTMGPAAAVLVLKMIGVLDWTFLTRKFEEWIYARQKQPGPVCRGTPLTQDYISLTQYTSSAVLSAVRRCMNDMKRDFFISPAFTNKLVTTTRYTSAIPLRTKLGYKSDQELYRKDELIFYLDIIISEMDEVPMMLYRLNDLFSRRPEEKQRLSSEMLMQLSNLSVLWKMYESLRTQYFGYDPSKCGPFEDIGSGILELWIAGQNSSLPKELKLGGKLERMVAELHVPHHRGRKDSAWLERADASQAKLAEIFDYAMNKQLGRFQEGGYQGDMGPLRKLFKLDPTPGVFPIYEQERARILTPKEKNGVKSHKPTPDFLLFQHTPEDKFVRLKIPPEHLNVDFQQLTLETNKPSSSPSRSVEEEQPTVAAQFEPVDVPKKRLRIAHHLFSRDQEPEGSVTIEDLAGLLADAGFQCETHGGAGHHFSKREGQFAGKCIVLHPPHPSSQYRKKQLDRIGYRLRRDFGMSEDTFRRKR
jgi:hypothetical protein